MASWLARHPCVFYCAWPPDRPLTACLTPVRLPQGTALGSPRSARSGVRALTPSVKGSDKKTLVITGAGSGIGAATADHLSSVGWNVIRTDRTAPDGGAKLDVRDEVEWRDVFTVAGPVHGLVNCAGIRPRSPIVDMELEEFSSVLDVHVLGTFLGIREAFRNFRTFSIPGVIVNISSTNAFHAIANQAHYAAAKAAVASLTRAAAVEAIEFRSRVNAVAPGPIDTPLFNERFAEPESRGRYEKQLMMGRVGTPVELASAIEFLLSDAASYITGATLTVDGGYSIRGPILTR
jgi:NAD(P)-dependent dehydrogenase (short-subunit alcohol dehydrogenase family)